MQTSRFIQAISLFVLYPLAVAVATPKIECEGRDIKFGTVLDRNSIEHIFTLKNAGSSVLKIKRMRSGCGCATIHLSEDKILPGKTAALKAIFDLSGRLGPQDLWIRLESNDRARIGFTVRLLGEVRRSVELVPSSIHFANVIGEPSVTHEVRVLAGGESGFKILSVRPETPGLYTLRTKALSSGRGYSIKVDLNPELLEKPIRFTDRAHIVTDHPVYSNVILRVAATIQEDIIVVPPEIVLRSVPPGAEASDAHYVVVRSPSRRPFEVLAVTPPGKSMGVEIRKRSDWEVVVRLLRLSRLQKGPTGSVVIHVRRKDGKKTALRVPIKNPG